LPSRFLRCRLDVARQMVHLVSAPDVIARLDHCKIAHEYALKTSTQHFMLGSIEAENGGNGKLGLRNARRWTRPRGRRVVSEIAGSIERAYEVRFRFKSFFPTKQLNS